MKRTATLLLMLPLALLASCGGGESDEDQIAAVVEQLNAAEEKPEIEVACNELLTDRFVKVVYGGDIQKCVDQPLNDPDESEDPGTTEVSSTTIEGESAEVKVTTVGGKTEGTEGTWTFRKQGGDWMVDEFGDDYLRSTFAVSVAVVDGGAFSYEPLRSCMSDQVSNLKSGELRNFMFQTFRGNKKRALTQVLSFAQECPHELAEYVADQLATRVLAKKDLTKAQIRCAEKRLIPLLQVTGLSSMALAQDAGSAEAFALVGLIAGVVKQCPAQ